ncbi:putative Subtilisin [Candidatus Zixiibacteriota bacterium]|nr:putative Subtilisin [candidate division Zixibacteria bacterium]
MRKIFGFKCAINAAAILLSLFEVAFGEYYYGGTGPKQLTICDSIIMIKFNPEVPQPSYGTFAQTVEGLDENFLPEQDFQRFYVFHVDEGYNIDTLINVLYDIPAVLFAFPAYYDAGGNVCKPNDNFVIAYKGDVAQETMDSMAAYYHVQQMDGPLEFTGSRVMAMTDYIGMNILEIANAFYESGLVDYSFPSMFVPQSFGSPPNDPLFGYQYHLKNTGQTGGKPGIDIAVEKAWEITNGDPNIVVALIDDGFERYHEDFNSDRIMWSDGYDFIGADARNVQPDGDASNGYFVAHGIACQGIISAIKNNGTGIAGIAPECNLLPLKICDDEGYPNADPTILERAISYALHLNQDRKYLSMVISCSWGWIPESDLPNIRRIIDTSSIMGVPMVFATGNFGELYPWGSSIGFPAFIDTVIAVGAVKNTGLRWNYSGTGPRLDVVAPSGYWQGFDAGDIYTTDASGLAGYNPNFVTCAFTDNNYLCTYGGTSAAAPQVAGILALVRSRRPDIKATDTLRMIIDSSAIDQIGDTLEDIPGFDFAYGYGLASASRALLAVVRGDADNSGAIDILDVSYLINFLYKSGPPPQPDDRVGDANCDGAVNIKDIAYLLQYLYHSGPKPQICFKY